MGEGKFSSLTKLTLLKGKLKLSTMIASVERQMYYNNNSLLHIKDKVKVASRVGCSERRVVYFRKLLFKSDKKKLGFRRVESQKVCSHPGRDLLYSILRRE